MRRASLLVLLGASVLLPCVALQSRPPASSKTKAAPPHAASHKTSPAASKGSSRTGTRSAAAKAKPGATRTVKTRLVKTKSGRWARVAVHAPPVPTYQTHPDPERYTEIQKALAERGFFKGDANGQWGDDSVDALRRFQAGSNLPDDGKISALTLSGLGLGPRHDGSTASTVPVPAAAAEPSVIGATVGPAASSPPPPPPTQLPVTQSPPP